MKKIYFFIVLVLFFISLIIDYYFTFQKFVLSSTSKIILFILVFVGINTFVINKNLRKILFVIFVIIVLVYIFLFFNMIYMVAKHGIF